MTALTNAERQARYRARQDHVARAVHLWLPDHEKAALKRLARHHGKTQAQLVADLLRQAEDAATAEMNDPQIDHYYHSTSLSNDTPTQTDNTTPGMPS